MRGIALLTAAFLFGAVVFGLLIALGTPVAAEETLLPEDELYTQMLYGDRDQAREGFKNLVTTRLSILKNLPGLSPENSSEGMYRYAGHLNNAVFSLKMWESAEAALRFGGAPTPEPVLQVIVEAVVATNKHARDLDRAISTRKPETAPLAVEQSQVSTLALSRTGDLLLSSVGFLRGTPMAGRRAELLSAAGKFVDAPKNIADFDAQFGGDLLKSMGIGAPPDPASELMQPGTQSNPRPLRDDEQALKALLEAFYKGVIGGEIVALKPLFEGGYWPENKLRDGVQDLKGMALQDLGRVLVEDLRDSLLGVIMEGMSMATEKGETRTMRGQLTVRRSCVETRTISGLSRPNGRDGNQFFLDICLGRYKIANLEIHRPGGS